MFVNMMGFGLRNDEEDAMNLLVGWTVCFSIIFLPTIYFDNNKENDLTR